MPTKIPWASEIWIESAVEQARAASSSRMFPSSPGTCEFRSIRHELEKQPENP